MTEARVRQVPGFGHHLTYELCSWRRSIEAGFVFDPKHGVDPADIAAVDRDIRKRRLELEAKLMKGEAELTQIYQRVLLARKTLLPQLEERLRALDQAKTDLTLFQ